MTALVDLIKQSGADAWELTSVETTGWEFYFIKHQLDQHRAKHVTHTHVTLYKTHEDGSVGSARGEIAPTLSDAQVQQELANLLTSASYVHNKAYNLSSPKHLEAYMPEEADVEKMSEQLISLMRSLPEDETKDINSYEIFTSKKKIQYQNSNGVNLSQTLPNMYLEVILNARDTNHEIELFRSFNGGNVDVEGIQAALEEALQAGKDRLVAKPTPKLKKYPVVFTNEHAVKIYEYFLTQLNTGMQFFGISTWKVGKDICEAAKEKFTIESLRFLPNSSCNKLFDDDGVLIQDRTLLEANVPQAFFGQRMFNEYTGHDDAFDVTNVQVRGVGQEDSLLKAGDYIEPIDFSDFSVNPQTGDISGEIRLAYWHHDGQVTPITGGSISGNAMSLFPKTHISKDLKQYDNMVIPHITRIDEMNIAGIE